MTSTLEPFRRAPEGERRFFVQRRAVAEAGDLEVELGQLAEGLAELLVVLVVDTERPLGRPQAQNVRRGVAGDGRGAVVEQGPSRQGQILLGQVRAHAMTASRRDDYGVSSRHGVSPIGCVQPRAISEGIEPTVRFFRVKLL